MQYQLRDFFIQKRLLILLIFVSNIMLGQTLDLYSNEIFVTKNDTLKYRMLLPKGFSENNQYPIILFLHGAGERGNDNKKQLVNGSALFAKEKNRDSFPAIVIFPQCPKEDYWSNVKVDRSKNGLEKFKYKKAGKPTKSMSLVLNLLDLISNKSYVNKNQIYAGGLSMGGMGTFDLLKFRPHMFAAAFTICGGGNPKSVTKYANEVALWIFQGGKDDIVHPFFSLTMATALQKNGGDVKLTYFENDNHNSWDSSFSEPKLLPWLFSKSKLKI